MMKEAFAIDEIIQEIYEPYDQKKEKEWRSIRIVFSTLTLISLY